MQRLFSTFPNGWPGTGLLLLRVAVATVVIADSLSVFGSGSTSLLVLLPSLGILLALALAAGLFTPIAGGGVALIEAGYAVRAGLQDYDGIFIALVAIALAMLGPGTWSVDARLYGRRRIDL